MKIMIKVREMVGEYRVERETSALIGWKSQSVSLVMYTTPGNCGKTREHSYCFTEHGHFSFVSAIIQSVSVCLIARCSNTTNPPTDKG